MLVSKQTHLPLEAHGAEGREGAISLVDPEAVVSFGQLLVQRQFQFQFKVRASKSVTVRHWHCGVARRVQPKIQPSESFVLPGVRESISDLTTYI